MKKLIMLIALIVLPIVSFSQDMSKAQVKQNDIITIKAVTIEQIINSNTAIAIVTKNEVTNLSYKKSIELISIKAYRKSLQIRTKEVKIC
ncbi:hypothetical protein [Gelidibacter maritimus]|uniref:Uncharacterized protein n=1 Tax=Gelidibacter maritimus TaxID=2761487 RepID=A0A7W2M3U2_9FLAO|nr:hypothetical protein [Gelidibacter maritimus]MBA6152214.1 hypothetical protein [Gelidibacter maritimus]